jgi:glycosyltransferase involved in cell wall biosynthesis
MIVIPNGFDLDEFRPDASARREIRAELGIEDAMLVGLVGRFDPHKDLRSFVSMAGTLTSSRDDVRFLGCGAGISEDNEVLMGWIRDGGLEKRFHLLGPRSDMPRVMAALDVLVSSSVSEGFPNVVGEAMAAGVPCVVTDVGDSALIVGDSGRVVPPGDHEALARECLDLLEDGASRRRLGGAARTRIAERFSLPEIASRYETLYEEMALACAD